jgi:hypothetical protein
MLDPGGTVTDSENRSIARVAVVGATGYLGGRLVNELLRQGFWVRAVSRSIEKMRCRPYAAHDRLEIARADASREDELTQALMGCSSCFWLISTTGHYRDPSGEGIAAARSLVRSAPAAGVSRIIYLGPPLGEERGGSVRDRPADADPGRILTSGSVPVTWLRIAMIIGSGSASFEILRYLTERLPCGDSWFAGGEVLDCSYRILLDCPPERVWPALRAVGGGHGWYFGDILWKLRGFLDRLLGGRG